MKRGPIAGRRPIAELLRERTVVTESGCMEWTAARDGQGYGQIRRDSKMHQAHRVSYETFVGPIPTGLHLDHLCRNRACINPEHLEPVTCRENILRGVGASARNAAKTHCPSGHPLVEGNLVVSERVNHRTCLTCRRVYMRDYMRARRARLRTGSVTA